MAIEKAIQFIVSPQRDLIGLPHERDDPDASDMYVGEEAVRKLRGYPTKGEPDPFVETTNKFFDTNIPGSERVSVVIDEDWHNSNHPEFMIYGRHCVKGTDGAKFVGKLESYRWEDKVHIIRANSINIANHPHFSEILQSIIGDTRPEHMRIGVYGVWTNIKVEYLLFNLHTLAPYFPPTLIGVCEPLTATPNQQWHDSAIEKFNLMGYQVFDDITTYLKWMGLEV